MQAETISAPSRSVPAFINAMAAALDAAGKKDAAIRIEWRDGTRRYLMAAGIKPKKRGGHLFVGEHRIGCLREDDQCLMLP